MKRPVVIIAGPTAGGKSALALGLAAQKNGTVINADSMQLYDGLPTLTAQPSREDRATVPHVLYGTLKPDDIASAERYRGMALEEIKKAHDKNLLPIVTGGTGFYIKALTEGLSPIPDIAPQYRDEAIALQQRLGNPGFHAELAKYDPATAKNLDPMNTQRVVRAWEVLAATGKGLAAWQATPRTGAPDDLSFFTITLLPPREKLYTLCDSRFDKMIDAGAIDDVRDFAAKNYATSPLHKALGYAEICAYLDKKISKQEMLDAAKTSTRHYAKRQTTWFRHQTSADLILETPDIDAVLNSLSI